MADGPIEYLPLRDLFTDAERFTRELIDHLERGFLPKLDDLSRVTFVPAGELPPEEIEDATVREHARAVLGSEAFTDEVYGKLDQYFRAIDGSVQRLTG